MKPELHLTKKDFEIEWFSGTGPGGQYRNKTQNCCRIRHIVSGLVSSSTKHRERSSNQRDAFQRLIAKLIVFFDLDEIKERREMSNIIRTYHFERNVATDGTLELPIQDIMNGKIDKFLINGLTQQRKEVKSGRV